MPKLHVCSWAKLNATVATTGARDVLTVIKNIGQVATPPDIEPARHLKLDFADIIAPMEGQQMASEAQVRDILAFGQNWDRAAPMVIHCYAGVSRSTASAFAIACALRHDIGEEDWAARIRRLSPTATPNLHLVALADRVLNRKGRMVRAIEEIGRGEDCFEGTPFSLDIGH